MHNLERYYSIHSRIYDLTRWTFLFGRDDLAIAVNESATPKKILEVGCGTGYNLLNMAMLFPEAELTGIDLSKNMLQITEKKLARRGIRVMLIQKPYATCQNEKFDLLLFSYSLSMMGDAWETTIEMAYNDMSEDGLIGIVDFHSTQSLVFEKWLKFNNVSILETPEEKLGHFFSPLAMSIKRVYFGLWSYYMYLGRRKK